MRTAQQLTIKGAHRLAQAKDTSLWRIRDRSMAPEFLPGDSVYVSPRLAPDTGDMVVARLANGPCLLRRYKASGKKAFALIPKDRRWPTIRVNSRSPGEVVGVVFLHSRKMRIDGKPRSAWSDAP
jgi:SOS-response transcriptional repressor LexA